MGTGDGKTERRLPLALCITAGVALSCVSLFAVESGAGELTGGLARGWPWLRFVAYGTVLLQLVALVAVWRGARRVPLRTLLYTLVTAAALFLALLQPFWRPVFDIAVCLAFGAFAAVVLIGPPLARRVPRRALRAGDLLLFNLCAIAVLLELGLRAYATFFPSQLFATTDANVLKRLDASRLPAGKLHYGFPANGRGFVDEPLTAKVEGETLVCVIGDSFSVGKTPHWFHYTTVCERALPRTRLHNIGVAATGPSEYAHLLANEAMPLAPDAIVIALFVGNDVWDAGKAHRGQPGLRRWFDRGNLLLYLVPRRLARLAAERRFLEGELDGGAGGERVDGLPRMLELWPWLADPLLEPPPFGRERFLSIETERALLNCGSETPEPWDNLWRDLRELARIARDVPFFVMLIPDEFQVEDELWRTVVARSGRDDLERDRPQHRIGAWLQGARIPFLDLLPACRAVPPMADGKRHLYHLQDTHFNRRGNALAGRELARFLRAQLGLK